MNFMKTKILVTPAVFDLAVRASFEMQICEGDFEVYLCNKSDSFKLDDIERKASSVLSYRQDFEKHQWYAKHFPLDSIVLASENANDDSVLQIDECIRYEIFHFGICGSQKFEDYYSDNLLDAVTFAQELSGINSCGYYVVKMQDMAFVSVKNS